MRWQNNNYRPTLELLEKRDLPASAMLSGGYLYITSTASHEFVTVAEANGQLGVANTWINAGGQWVATVSAAQVKTVAVYAYGGGDVINLRPSAATTVTTNSYIVVYGGNNQVFGGAGQNYIAAGDSAGYNQFYGWTNTDYLAAGSPTDQLTGGGGFDWFYQPFNPWNAFVNGEHVSDVKQGYSPSCQTCAALAEAVDQGFNFGNSMRYLGNSEYDISLYGGAQHETVNFNGWYNSSEPQPTVSGEFWTVLMYRARLESLGIDPSQSYADWQWDQANQQMGGRIYSVGDALYAFTGQQTVYGSMNELTPVGVANALGQGQFVIVSSDPGSGITSDGIVRDHAYAVLNCYYHNGQVLVQMYNPWAFDSMYGITIESLAGGTPQNLGFITLTWQQFVNSANFQGFTWAAANKN